MHSGVGAITESDVLLASASNAIIIGFNVRPERKAQELAEQEKVDIRLHSIIYELQDEMKKAMTGCSSRPSRKPIWAARKCATPSAFPRSAPLPVARSAMASSSAMPKCGCCATTWSSSRARSARCKRFKDDASEVRNGMECGIGIANYGDIKVGDVIEVFVTERVAAEAFV